MVDVGSKSKLDLGLICSIYCPISTVSTCEWQIIIRAFFTFYLYDLDDIK